MTTQTLTAMLLVSAQAAAVPPVPSFRAVYEVETNGFDVATIVVKLSVGVHGEFIYQQDVEAHGWASLFGSADSTERSRGHFEGRIPRSVEYAAKKRGGDAEENAHLTFDRANLRIRSIGTRDEWELPLSPTAIDPLLVRLAMMIDLAKGRRTLRYDVPRQGRMKTYEFAVVGEEIVAIDGQKHRTLKLARTDDERDRTWIWSAPHLRNLPVRILKQRAHGFDTVVSLRKVEFD